MNLDTKLETTNLEYEKKNTIKHEQLNNRNTHTEFWTQN